MWERSLRWELMGLTWMLGARWSGPSADLRFAMTAAFNAPTVSSSTLACSTRPGVGEEQQGTVAEVVVSVALGVEFSLPLHCLEQVCLMRGEEVGVLVKFVDIRLVE